MSLGTIFSPDRKYRYTLYRVLVVGQLEADKESE